MRFALGEAGRRGAAMAIGATQHDVRAGVHAQRIDALVTFQAAAAFSHRLFPGLVDSVAGWQRPRAGFR